LWYVVINNNNNNEWICKVQNKWSSDALHRRAGIESFQFLRKCLNGIVTVIMSPSCIMHQLRDTSMLRSYASLSKSTRVIFVISNCELRDLIYAVFLRY